MATVTEAVRRLRIEATSSGVKEATQDAKALAGGMNDVAVAAQKQEKAVQSAESRLNSIQRRYDATFRAQMDQARVERDLQRAQDQGLITMQRRVELLSLAAERHGLASAAIARETAQVEQLTAATQRLGAANDNQWRRRNLTYQLFDVGQMLALGQNPGMTALQQGPQIAQLYAGNGGVNAALRETGSLLGGIVRAFPIVTALTAAAGVAFGGLAYEINQTTDVSVGLGDTMLATVQVIANGIATLLQPAIAAIGPYVQATWDGIVAGTKLVGNTIINSFRAAFEDLKLIFTQFPNIVAVGVAGAANAVVSGIETMINYAVQAIDWLISKVNALPDWLKPESFENIGALGSVSLGRVNAGTAGSELSDAIGQRNANIASIMGSDPLGQFFDAVKVQAVANAMSDVEKETAKAGKTARDAADGWRHFGREAARAIEETISFAQDLAGGFVSDLRSGLQEGAGLWGAFADAAMNALDKVTEKLIGMATDQLITNLLGGLFGGGFLSPKAFGDIQAGRGGLFANGGVFDRSGVTAFANGGVVNTPTVFPFARGIGLMGEAGPEAIMPLHRGPDGSLGVKADNQNGANVLVQVINNSSGTQVREEKSTGPNMQEVRRIIIEDVKSEFASGGFDKPMKRYQGGGLNKTVR